MIVPQEYIQKAKEILGDQNAEIISSLLGMADYNPTRRVGRCPCEGHRDSTPSCSYNPKTYNFKCFGCGYTADIIEALMQSKKLTFLDACKELFELAGIQYDFTEQGSFVYGYEYPKPQYSETKERVYEYWGTRGISKETIDYLGIEEDVAGNTLFQYFDQNDVLTMVKVRKSRNVKGGETKIWHLTGCDKRDLLYNINRVNTVQPLVICSGEGDCASAIEAGVYNAVSIPGGDGNLNWITECWDFLQNFSEIILVADNDDSGAKFAETVSRRLGEHRVKIVDLPKTAPHDGVTVKIKDLNLYLRAAGPQAVREIIKQARDAAIVSVVDYTDVKKFDMSDVEGFVTHFSELDMAIDKFYVGSTTILTGIAGSGKSSFLSWLTAQSVQQGFPTFVYSGELSNPSLKNWIDSVHAGQWGVDEHSKGDSKYYKLKSEAFNAINNYYKNQIFIYKDGVGHKTDEIFSTMEAVVRKYGVRTILIDNMSSVDLQNNDNDKWMRQDEFIRSIIEFSTKWQVCCVVVLHPKKMDMVRRMSIFDLQGVVSAVNLAHRVISLYRVPSKEKAGIMGKNGKIIEPPIKWDVVLEVLKDRFGSGTGKTAGLFYDIPSKRFFDTERTLRWQFDWDKADRRKEELPFYPPQLLEEDDPFGTTDEIA